MKEKAIKRYNSVRVLTPMVYALNLSGCRLLTFAYIQGFCNDEASVCYSSIKTISDTIGYAQRTIDEALRNLKADGFIYKVGTRTIDGQEVNGYRTYFFELMDRYDAGETIKPTLLRTRRGSKKEGSAQCTLPYNDVESGAQCTDEVAHNVQEGSAQCADKSNMNLIDESKESLSESARAREAEEREFFKIFYLNNAADPASEVKRFVGYYQSKGWQDTAGRKYDTRDKRIGLAYGWTCKGAPRLPVTTAKEESRTKKFYTFLGTLYNLAQERGGLDPMLILDKRGKYAVSDQGNLHWWCKKEVADWCEALPDFRQIIQHNIGAVSLFYQYIP